MICSYSASGAWGKTMHGSSRLGLDQVSSPWLSEQKPKVMFLKKIMFRNKTVGHSSGTVMKWMMAGKLFLLLAPEEN